jgi:hypothetical protein
MKTSIKFYIYYPAYFILLNLGFPVILQKDGTLLIIHKIGKKRLYCSIIAN